MKKIKLDDSNSIKCWCQGCGQEFRIHPLYPIVRSDEQGQDLAEHKCPHTIPTPTFKCDVIELKPMEMPSSLLFQMDYRYGSDDIKDLPMSDGMSDGYRMEREALAAEDREEKEQAEFDLKMARSMRNLRDQLADYLGTRSEYFHMDDYQQKLYPTKKAELKEKLKQERVVLGMNLDRLSEMLKKKL